MIALAPRRPRLATAVATINMAHTFPFLSNDAALWLTALAAGKGAGSVWLTTNAENAPAIAFYQGNGFDRVGTTAFRIADQAYPNAVFSRATAR